MLKMNYKKALLAATVLTAFCANAAFAGDTPAKPTMRERVDQILNCNENCVTAEQHQHKKDNDSHKRGKCFDRQRKDKEHRVKLTKEQKEERAARREAWKKMSPEERKAAAEKWRAERRAKHQEQVDAKMNKLTPEQRQQVEDFIKKDRAFHQEQREAMRKHREAQRDEMRNMTDEQRDAIHAQKPPKIGKHHKAPHNKEHRPMPPMECVNK